MAQITYEEILRFAPALGEYTRFMPKELWNRFSVRVFPPQTIIHQKDSPLKNIGIVCRGQHRVINEFENGNIFVIEKNEAISFIGEVALLAGKHTASVTIETITECMILFFLISDFEKWLEKDNHFLRLLSRHVAAKLYRSSYDRGLPLFYSAKYILLKYIIDYAKQEGALQGGSVIIKKTRQQLYEETGMTPKTQGRTINSLRKEGIISTQKGKILISGEQYPLALKKAKVLKQYNQKGFF
jgi:CRP/FNR family cyclic AMP-dependent transcriptional regulator